MEEKSSVFWDIRVDPNLRGKVRAMLIMPSPTTAIRLEETYGSFAGKLHNLELNSELDNKLPIDFDLYQMENF